MAWIREILLACVIVTFCAGAAAQYAPPNYLYSSDAYRIHIAQVSLNGWSYNMADRATEYSYHAGVGPATLHTAIAYTVTLTNGGSYAQGVTLFFDLNTDGDFADAGEAAASVTLPASGSAQMTFTLAATVSPAATRMRLMSAYGLYAGMLPLNPAGNYEWGQCDDFDAPIGPASLMAPVIHAPIQTVTSPALITEVAYDPVPSHDEFIEIMNVTGGPLDLSGWSLVVIESTATLVDPVKAGTLAPGAKWVFCDVMGSSGTNPPSNQLLSSNLILQSWWGVMLVDGRGVVRDAVFAGNINYPLLALPFSLGSQYKGATVPALGRGSQVQRQGSADHNDASDWVLTTTHSISVTNPGMSVPFVPRSDYVTIAGGGSSYTGLCLVGASLEIAFSATDANPLETLNFTINHIGGTLTPAAAGFTTAFPFAPTGGASPCSAAVDGTAATPGTCLFEILVADGTYVSSQTFALTIVHTAALSVGVTTLHLGVTTAATPGASQSYVLTGIHLTSDVVVTAPTGVELSAGSASGPFATTLILTPAAGSVAATIYVRISDSAAVGPIAGAVTHTSAGAPPQDLNVTGTVLAPNPAPNPPTNPTGGGSGDDGGCSAQPDIGVALLAALALPWVVALRRRRAAQRVSRGAAP